MTLSSLGATHLIITTSKKCATEVTFRMVPGDMCNWHTSFAWSLVPRRICILVLDCVQPGEFSTIPITLKNSCCVTTPLSDLTSPPPSTNCLHRYFLLKLKIFVSHFKLATLLLCSQLNAKIQRSKTISRINHLADREPT